MMKFLLQEIIKQMQIFFILTLLNISFVFIFSTGAKADLIGALLGFKNYQSCISNGLDTAKSSREIKKVYDVCEKKFPDAKYIVDDNENIISTPYVESPVVPLTTTPSLPIVPSPTK